MRTLAVLLLLGFASPALAEEKAPEPKKEEMTPAEVAKAKKVFTEMADAVIKNQASCPKMGAKLDAVIKKHEAWLKKVVESKKEMPQAAKDELQKKQTDMMTAIMKCKDDPAVTAAVQRLMAIGSAKK